MSKRNFSNPAAEFLTGDPGQQHQHRPGGCSAFGCPLAGAFSQSKDGRGHWYCFLHFGMKPEANDIVTARINANVWIAQLWSRVRKLDGIAWKRNLPLASAYCEKQGRGDLAPAEDEAQASYVARLRNALSLIARPRNDETESQQLDLEAA